MEFPEARALLSARLSEFVSRPTRWRVAIRRIREMLAPTTWKTFVFGGTIRDIVVHSASYPPRDLDLVVDGAEIDELASLFADYVVRQTRFGGLHLLIDRLPVDIWTLESTWAFKSGGVLPVSPAQLPKTTFFNVEAVVAELFPRRGCQREVYEAGFFESLATRTLDLNYLDNPYPALCVARTIVMSMKLGFSLSPRLATRLHELSLSVSWEDVHRVQLTHYGRLWFDQEYFSRCLSVVGSVGRESVSLPASVSPSPVQLAFA